MKSIFNSNNPYTKKKYIHFLNKQYRNKKTKIYERFFLVDKFIKQNGIKSVLDCGCSEGSLLINLRKNKKLQLFGCEINKLYTNQKKLKKLKIEVFLDDATKLKTKKKFDLILCFGVIQFEQNPIKIINNFYKNLNKNGYLIISSQNPFFNFVTFNSISKRFLNSIKELNTYKLNKISKNFLNSKDALDTLSYKPKFNHVEIFNPFTLASLFRRKISYVKSIYYGYHNNPLVDKGFGKYRYKKTNIPSHQIWKKFFFSSGVLSVFKRN